MAKARAAEGKKRRRESLSWSAIAKKKQEAWWQRPSISLSDVETARNSHLLLQSYVRAGANQEELAWRSALDKWCFNNTKVVPKALGWSDDRFWEFLSFANIYIDDPSPENYLSIRENFPEIEFDVSQFGSTAFFGASEEDWKKNGIDPYLVGNALDGDFGLDELCLHLLKSLIAREKIQKGVAGYIQQRRNFVTDSIVDFLIIAMLESLLERRVRVPSSLVVLARYRLIAGIPQFYKRALSRNSQLLTASLIANVFPLHEKPSVRKLKRIANVKHMTAARWLQDEYFQDFMRMRRRVLNRTDGPRPKVKRTRK